LGYTVVDSSTVIATHLSRLLEKHAHELLGHDEAQQLLERLARLSPKLAEALVPGTLPLSTWLWVLQGLLREQVPLRDLRSIAEALVRCPSKEPAVLLASTRIALGRAIVQQIAGNEELAVITLDGALEQLLMTALKQAGSDDGLLLEPNLQGRLREALSEACEQQENLGKPAVLLVANALRAPLARLGRNLGLSLYVLAFAEIPEQRQIRLVQCLGQNL